MIERILRAFRGKASVDAPEVQRASADFRIPVLCYHSWTINGPDYETNDHVALEQDLKLLGRRGYEVLSVPDLLAALHGEKAGAGESDCQHRAVLVWPGILQTST